MLFVTAFIVAMLFNFFIILFGKKDLEQLKAKMSIGKYMKEINDGLISGLGDTGATLIKLAIAIIVILFIIFNLIPTLLTLLVIAIGTFTAKKAYRIGAVSNILNKIATYINRLRN